MKIIGAILISMLIIGGYYAMGLIPSVAIERAIIARKREAGRRGIRKKMAQVVGIFGHPDPKGARVFRDGSLLCTITDYASVDKTYEVQWRGEVVFTAVPAPFRRSESEMVLRYAPGDWESQLESHFARSQSEARNRQSEEARRLAKQRVKNWGV